MARLRGVPVFTLFVSLVMAFCLIWRWQRADGADEASAAALEGAPSKVVCKTVTHQARRRRQLLREELEELEEKADVSEVSCAQNYSAAQQEQERFGAFPAEEEGVRLLRDGARTLAAVSPRRATDLNTDLEDADRIWLPIGVEEEGFAMGDPWIRMCLIDYGSYAAQPDAIPMYESLVRASRCATSPSYALLIKLSDALAVTKRSCGAVEPSGFVFHETRCGSTLVANMLASVPSNRVFSESRPPVQVIRTAEKLDMKGETVARIFKGVITLMGRRRATETHERLFFKLQNAKFSPLIMGWYPDVPFVYVFRDPVEVLVSNIGKGNPGGAPCVRDALQAPNGKKALWGDATGKVPRAKLNAAVANACAEWLRMLCDRALEASDAHPAKASFVDYRQLPEAMFEHLYPGHFGLGEADKVVDWRKRMQGEAVSYSKGFGSKKGKVFTNDTVAKHQMADPLLEKAAEAYLYDTFQTLQRKQAWVKSGRRR